MKKYISSALIATIALIGSLNIVKASGGEDVILNNPADYTTLDRGFGKASGNVENIGLKYTATHDQFICRIDLPITVLGSATDQVLFYIYGDGFDGSTLIKNKSIDHTLLPSDPSNTFTTFFNANATSTGDNCFALSGGASIYIELKRSGTYQNVPSYNWIGKNLNSTLGPTLPYTYISGVWSQDSPTTKQYGIQIYGIDSVANSAFPRPSSTSTNLIIAQCTDSTVPSLCYLMGYLFIPDQSYFTKFTTMWTEIQNKPPIGYFTQGKNLVDNLNTTTATSTSNTFTLPTPIKSITDNIFNVIFALLGITYAYNRIKKLDAENPK